MSCHQAACGNSKTPMDVKLPHTEQMVCDHAPGRPANPAPLRPQVVRFLASCPKAGKGVHQWLFKAALLLHGYRVPVGEIFAHLTAAMKHCGRSPQVDEIRNAIQNSSPEALSRQKLDSPPWPAVNQRTVDTITKNGPGLEVLEQRSPFRIEDQDTCAELIIDRLFAGDDLLCIGASKKCSRTQPREKWRGHESKREFIVPSAMTAPYGRTKNGKLSNRCLGNTGRRRYMVIEFDNATIEHQASLLLHLAKYLPLVVVVHSGGKSLHGWFRCGDREEPHVRKFMTYAVSLGADRATWTRCQLVRLPGGLRDNGNRQRVLFFNPSAGEAE